MVNDLPVLEEFNDITGGVFKRLGKPFVDGHETNDILEGDEEGFLQSLGRAIGGGGVPGADFPIHYEVPETGFSCGDGSLVGYYADVDPKAACQVFHICQEDGRHDAFLCPIGTLFNQKYFVCDWWYNVDCNRSAEFYSLNEFLLKENKNRGLRPIHLNLKNRTESFEQIIEDIRNVKANTALFANKLNTGLFSNLNSSTEVDNKIDESDKGASQSREIEDENFDIQNKDGKMEAEEEEMTETEITEKVGEEDKKIEKGNGKEKKDQKGDKEGIKGVIANKEENEENRDSDMKVEVVVGEEGKPESATETTEEGTLNKEELVPSDEERKDDEDLNKAEDPIEDESKVTIETTKESKDKDRKKIGTKSNNKYKESKKEATTENKVNQAGLQNGDNQIPKLGGSKKTPSASKDNKTNGIKKNGLSSTTLNNKVPHKEEIMGYSYHPKDNTGVEDILSKKTPFLNSYGVVTDNLVNKKGIRN
ncbi:hypothetical protein Anas_11262 [Armadillidium nasatum]|uniref:Chitin-binding type-2 domain-containing protein n=1 Tax=Armadillidium nasatum TaxID=96803 RepID=A0A5N5TFI2_9CRUS|nr:hypothetical protein Anas_11262 [Armadillidium nasatum]